MLPKSFGTLDTGTLITVFRELKCHSPPIFPLLRQQIPVVKGEVDSTEMFDRKTKGVNGT